MAQGRSDEEKAAFIQPFEDALAVKEGENALEEDADRRRSIVKLVLEQITGVGEGSEKGSCQCCSHKSFAPDLAVETEGFFNLFFSHFLTLFPIDAPETREQLLKLVQIVSQSNAPASTQFRMYVERWLPFLQFTEHLQASLTSSTLSPAALVSACQ